MRRRAFVRLTGLVDRRARGPERAGSERASDCPSSAGRKPRESATARGSTDAWDATAGKGVLWKVRIPGLAHSSPVVWGEPVLRHDRGLRPARTRLQARPLRRGHGLRGPQRAAAGSSSASTAHGARSSWERTAYEGVAAGKAPHQATYANATPATDGATSSPSSARRASTPTTSTGQPSGSAISAASTPAPTTTRATSGARPARRSSTATS